ncbi:c1 repressor inactivator [Cronobacter sakazakii]|nr:c1 repressor inactivator [Cronobacter sakazakii]
MFFEPTTEDIEACVARLNLDISSPDADRAIAREFVNYSNQQDRVTADDMDDLADVIATLMVEFSEKSF